MPAIDELEKLGTIVEQLKSLLEVEEHDDTVSSEEIDEFTEKTFNYLRKLLGSAKADNRKNYFTIYISIILRTASHFEMSDMEKVRLSFEIINAFGISGHELSTGILQEKWEK